MKFRTIYAYLWLDIVRPYLLPVTKMDLIFYQKISKSVIIFLLEIEGFWGGVKPGPLESPIIQLMVYEKIFGGYY